MVAPGVSTSSTGSASSAAGSWRRRRRDLAIGGVAARLADDQHVLARGVEDHELVGERAAHHPHVRRDGDGVQTQALEDPAVRAVVRPVRGVQARLVAVAAVRVLHHELAHADQPAAGPWLVAPLRLEVVDDHRQLAVALDDVPQEVRDDLLVGHRQDHVVVPAVLEARHLGADHVVPAGLAPQVRRVDHRHLHLLAADRVELLADDLLDALVDAEAERQQRVDPGPELADVSRPEQQAVRRHLGLGGVVAERGEEQVGQTHGAKDTGRARRRGPGSRSGPGAARYAVRVSWTSSRSS